MDRWAWWTTVHGVAESDTTDLLAPSLISTKLEQSFKELWDNVNPHIIGISEGDKGQKKEGEINTRIFQT